MIPFDKLTSRQIQFFDLGDKRLNARAKKSLKILMNNDPMQGFPCIFNDQYDLKGFYRLMNNKKVTPEKIAAGYQQGLFDLLSESAPKSSDPTKVYYQYQDTTYGSYLHRKETLDLGYVENLTDNGVVIHTGILTDQSFTPLGISYQKQILRDRSEYQKAHARKKRPFEQKESYKWVEAMQWCIPLQQEYNVRIVHIADREGDMTNLFNYAFDHDLHFIVRSRHDRIIKPDESNDQHKFWDYLKSQIPKAQIVRKLIDSSGKAYTAKCAIFWETIQPKSAEKPIQVVYLRQLEKPDNGTPAQWAFYTNLPIDELEQAVEILDIYTHRWRTCEDFHKCLKSGCQIEKRQFESAHAMTNCITMLSLTAIHILRMRHLATLEDQSVKQVLDELQCQLAYHLATKYLKPIDLTICQPGTVLWLTLLIGRMGGHQGFKQKGLPGWKTLWLGWSDFKKLMDGIILSKNIFKPT